MEFWVIEVPMRSRSPRLLSRGLLAIFPTSERRACLVDRQIGIVSPQELLAKQSLGPGFLLSTPHQLHSVLPLALDDSQEHIATSLAKTSGGIDLMLQQHLNQQMLHRQQQLIVAYASEKGSKAITKFKSKGNKQPNRQQEQLRRECGCFYGGCTGEIHREDK